MNAMAGQSSARLRSLGRWVVVATLASAVGTLVLTAMNGSVVHGATASWNGWREVSSWCAVMLFATVLGVVIAATGRGNPIAGTFIAAGFFGVVSVLGDQYAGYALVTAPGGLPGGVAARIFSYLTFQALWFVAAVFLPSIFPTGRLVSLRWRWVVRLGAMGAALTCLVVVLPNAFADNGLLGDVPSVTNPLASKAIAPLAETGSGVGLLVLFGATFLSVISLVVRTVRSRGVERQQIKVVAYTIAVTTVLQLFIANTIGLVRFIGATTLWDVFSLLSLWAVPASIAIALLRYRLYEVDRLINRTIVYVALTGLLAGVYFVAVIAFGSISQPLTKGSDLAVAGATLVIAGLFTPLRWRVQRFVDRRFYRTRYDAARTLEDFVSNLRHQTDLVMLQRQIEGVAWETMKPSTLGLWVPPQKG